MFIKLNDGDDNHHYIQTHQIVKVLDTGREYVTMFLTNGNSIEINALEFRTAKRFAHLRGEDYIIQRST